ncbi:MAG: radical SAM/SPASM domain-containing protein [Candidatus Muiribacteriota bacterium]
MLKNFFDNTVLGLEVTNFCNCSCIMCTQSQNVAKKGFMDKKIFSKLIDEIVQKDMYFDKLIPFGLGESTLHPEFNDFLAEIFRINETGRYFKTIDLHTNGTGINEEVIELISNKASVPFTLSFSLDAASSETYYNIRKNRSFDKVVNNIEKLFKRRKKTGVPRITLQFIIMEENKHEVLSFYNYWKNFLKKNRIDFQTNYDWHPPMIKDTIFFKRLNPIKHENLAKSEKLHFDKMVELGLIKNKSNREERAVESREYRGEKRRYPCSGPFKYVMVNWEGEVTVCCIDTLRELSLGNIKNVSLEDLWHSKKCHNYRLAHIKGELETMPKCIKCNNLDSPEINKKELEKYLKKYGFDEYLKYLEDF